MTKCGFGVKIKPYDIKKNFQKAMKASKVRKVIVYEEAEQQKINDAELTKEQKINLIRYGPDAITNKTKKIAINLLAKYKPMINL